jgi:hypothetical protein
MKEKEEDLENNNPNFFKRKRIYIIHDDEDDDDNIKFKEKRRRVEFSDEEKKAFMEKYNKYEKLRSEDFMDLANRFKDKTPYQFETYYFNHKKKLEKMPFKTEKIKRLSKKKKLNDYNYKWNYLNHPTFENYKDVISFNKKFKDPNFFVVDPFKIYLNNKNNNNKDYF